MTTRPQLVVSIFQDHTQAEQAINELHQAGFDNQQIRFAGHGMSTLEKIKSAFTGQDISAGGIYNDLVNMGTPPEDARYYQSELEVGRTIVLVVGTATPLVAINILAHYGGYGASPRSSQSADYDSTNVQQPTNGDVNVEPNRSDGRSAQYADYRKDTDLQQPTNEDVNAEPHRSTV